MKNYVLVLAMAILFAGNLAAQENEIKGSFGVVIAKSFVKFDYTITYLGDSYQSDQLAFRINFTDTKGHDLCSEIKETETRLKNLKNQSLQGKVQTESNASALLLFPKGAFDLKGRTKVYTEVKGIKLVKEFVI